jgi:hypothetical protein
MPRCTALLRSSVMPWWLRATREFSPVPLTWLERGRIRCKRSDPENLQMFAQARRILYQRLWSRHSHFARKRPQRQVYICSKALYKCSSQKIRPAGTVGSSRSWTFGPWCAIFLTLRSCATYFVCCENFGYIGWPDFLYVSKNWPKWVLVYVIKNCFRYIV